MASEAAGPVRKGRPCTRLPADATSFEGRRDDLSQVKGLLADARLLTLTGFGGVGKTRLALRTARELSRTFPDGVTWMELADVRDPSLLRQAIVDALDMADRPGRDTWATALHHFQGARMLVVLDNCEHVLGEVALLVDELLRHAPEVRILATSRQVLGVPGERVFEVAPLPVPPAEHASDPGVAALYPAVALFRERAAAVVPGFELTPANQAAAVAVCRKLEGIPLAIELAAVKLRVLGIDELVRRLDARLKLLRHPARTGPSRHRTIEATIDWSYDLCTADERLLWARASVFVGGFDMEAAERVCSDDALPEDAVLEVVQSLVEKSILVRSETGGRVRFRLLEPLREHGLSRLQAQGEHDQLLHRHLAWVQSLLAEACLQWFGPTQEQWCTTLRQEQPNVRAAAEHCLDHAPCREATLTLLGSPWFLWIALFLDEGRQWLERTVAACPEPSAPRARALGTLAYVAALQGDLDRADEVTAEARQLAERFDEPEALAYTIHMAGLSALFHDPLRSVELLEEALPLYENHDVVDDLVVGLRVQLGLAYLFTGDTRAARDHFTWCQQLCERTGERWLLSYALFGLGFVEKVEGNTEAAVALAREALEIKWFFRDLCGLSTTMDLLAWLHADAGRHEEAAVLLGAAERLWTSFGIRLFGSEDWLGMMRRAEEAARRGLGNRAFDAAFRSGRDLDHAEAIAHALGRTTRPAAPAASQPQEAVRLTRREEQVSLLVADGLSNREIAERLVISQRTAEGHVENLLAKLGFHSRSQVAAWVGERRSVTAG